MSKIYTSTVSGSIPFDNSGTEYVADNMQDAILEAGASAFGYKSIQPNQNVSIPAHQQMCIRQHITVKGSLIIKGELVIL